MDVDRLRAETPGCERVVHFNNCGAGLMPRPVLDVVERHLEREAAIGAYEAADEAEDRLAAVYASVARLVNARPDEIAVVENATRAWDMAFYALGFRPGDRILTSIAEYASNYIAFLQIARRTGAVVEPVPNDASGQLDVAALESMLDDRVRVVAVTHVPTNGGLVNPAAAIGARTRARGIPFLLDACQSVGQIPIDVEAMGVDMLSATSRKYLRGPRGCGFLYVSGRWLDRLEPPFLDLHAAEWTARDAYRLRPDARRFENWECNVAAKLGMGAAVDYALALGVGAVHARVVALAAALRERLAALPGVRVLDQGAERCGIVSFQPGDRDPRELVLALRAQRINASSSTTASTRLDMEGRDLAVLMRAGVHCYNTEAEIATFVGALERLLA